MDSQEFATIIHDVYMVFILNLIRYNHILIMTKSMYSNFIKYSLSRYFIIFFSLLVCSNGAKSQEKETISFISYQNYLPTPQIGVYQFYEKLLRAFPKSYGRINIDFNVMKDSSVTKLNFTGRIYGTDSLQQKFKNISKWIPANKDGRPINTNQYYSFNVGKLSHIGDIGHFFNKSDSVVVYDKDHIRYIGARWLDQLYVSSIDYYYNKGKIKKIVIKTNNIKKSSNDYDNYQLYKVYEQLLVFYYGLPTTYIKSPTIPRPYSKLFYEMIKEIENKDYSVSWNDFLDGKILLETNKGITQITYEFY